MTTGVEWGAGSGPTRAGALARAALRHASGVVLGGLLAAVAWLIVMQEGVLRGWTEHDYLQTIGQVVVGRADNVARAGMRLTLVLAVGIAAIYALVFDRFVRGRGWTRALIFAAVPFLLWGLVLAPFAGGLKDTAAGEARVEIPGGPFGLDGGGATILIGAVASVVYAFIVARCYRLMRQERWWVAARERPGALAREAIEEIITPGSLELPEERREDSGERAGG